MMMIGTEENGSYQWQGNARSIVGRNALPTSLRGR